MAQAYLSDFDHQPEPEAITEDEHTHPQETRALTDAQTDDRTVCHNCGTKVTQHYRRVFGDNENRLWACSECHTLEDLFTGAGARP